jgi:hypothetical protein
VHDQAVFEFWKMRAWGLIFGSSSRVPASSEGVSIKARYAVISLPCLYGYPECSRLASSQQILGGAWVALWGYSAVQVGVKGWPLCRGISGSSRLEYTYGRSDSYPGRAGGGSFAGFGESVYGNAAMHSTSTRAPRARPEAARALRAG